MKSFWMFCLMIAGFDCVSVAIDTRADLMHQKSLVEEKLRKALSALEEQGRVIGAHEASMRQKTEKISHTIDLLKEKIRNELKPDILQSEQLDKLVTEKTIEIVQGLCEKAASILENFLGHEEKVVPHLCCVGGPDSYEWLILLLIIEERMQVIKIGIEIELWQRLLVEAGTLMREYIQIDIALKDL